MRCPVCSAEAPKGALFCQQCGGKLPTEKGAGGTTAPLTAAASPTAGRVEPDAGGVGAAIARRRPTADTPEETLWEGGYSAKAMLGPIVLGIVASVLLATGGVYFGNWPVPLGLFVVVWLVILAQYARRRLGISYKMTNQMFYHRRGILSRTTDRIEAIDIDDIAWHQGLFERMVTVGTVTITSRDKSNPKFDLLGIDNVEDVARLIDKARRAERLRRGVLMTE